MKSLPLLFLIFLSVITFAQVPDPPFNPMTAPGAKGIHLSDHILFWQNPESVTYNQLYFSADSLLVANSDSSVRVLSGFPSTVYSSFNLINYGYLGDYVKYYWKVVEYNSSGNSLSPVWWFNSIPSAPLIDFTFDSSMQGWEIIGPQGLNNWYWSNSSHTNSSPGEMVFRWDPVFIGDSYIMSPEFIAPEGYQLLMEFSYYEDWWSDTVEVGFAYTTDNGISWTTVWDLLATGNVGPGIIFAPFEVSGKFRLGFFYTGNSNNIDFFYVDDFHALVLLSTPYSPPSLLKATANDSIQKVVINWNEGTSYPPNVGFTIQRKNGLPSSTEPYQTIVTTQSNIYNYEDYNVELNQIYTYRIRTQVGLGSPFGNEATAYVPAIVPVELLSFSSSVIDNDVTLNWMTATETNNSGFQIERNTLLNPLSRGEAEGRGVWENIGFVNGNGTTTETKTYSFKDENLSTGKYQYRLKQIDFDGTFEYSNIVEAEILPPAIFSLEQNFPNPFNPSTKISWQSPVNSHQTLKIYDVLGNEVATLVNEYRTAGKYEAEFNANNLASGIYYYQLKVGEFVQTKKMVLIK